MTNMEIWKDVKGYGGCYKVSNYGSVIRVAGTRKNKWGSPSFSKEKEIKSNKNMWGYEMVNLYDANIKLRKRQVHRIVAEAFIPNPENKRDVNHINGDKTDNRVENLEWITHRGNMIHARDNNLLSGLKISSEDANEIKRLYATGQYTQRGIGLQYGIDQSTVSYIVNNKRWMGNCS